MSALEIRQALAESEPRARIGLALDKMTWREAFRLMELTAPYIGFVKTNSRMRSLGTLHARQRANAFGFELMGDAKCFDTERTTEDDVRVMTNDLVRFITVHAAMPQDDLQFAREGRDAEREMLMKRLGDKFDPFIGTLFGITVLTSYDEEKCMDTYGGSIQETTTKFGLRAARAGFEGLVSGVPDLWFLQAHPELRPLLKLTPGIVLPGTKAKRGQQRTATPGEAFGQGADLIILGSAVTQADDPAKAASLAYHEAIEVLGG